MVDEQPAGTTPPLHYRTPAFRRQHPARRETVNVVITAVLLASLVCLLIVGGVAGDPGGPARPRPSTEPPLTNRSSQLDPSEPAATAPGR